MISTARTDIHRPSAPEFDPTDYTCAGVFDLHPDAFQGPQRMAAVNELLGAGYRRGGVHPLGQCSHCGAYLRYTALMTHEPTRTYLWIGEQCLGNRFELESKEEFAALRKAAALNRQRAAKVERIAELVAEHSVLGQLIDSACASAYGDFIADVAYRFRSNGELSQRQIEAVERIIPQQIERAHEQALRMDAEWGAPVVPAPAGRMVVTGEVLSTRWQDNDFGGCFKMLVKATEGYRVWVTVPADLDVERGQHVKFTATLKPKAEDPAFAIGSRPAKASIVDVPSFA